MMNSDELEQMPRRLLPAGMRSELDTRAAKHGLKPIDLIDAVMESAMLKSPAYLEEMQEVAIAITEALELGIDPSWPESFDDCIAVGSLLSVIFERGFDDHLLEIEGAKMDIVE